MDIGEIVGHIGGTRLYFASAYRGEGWIWAKLDEDMADQRNWPPWLETSAERYAGLCARRRRPGSRDASR